MDDPILTPVQRIVKHLEDNDYDAYKKQKWWFGTNANALIMGVVSSFPHTTQSYVEFVLKDFLEGFEKNKSKDKINECYKTLMDMSKMFSIEQCLVVAQVTKALLPEKMSCWDNKAPYTRKSFVANFVLEVLSARTSSIESPMYEQLLSVPEKPLTREVLCNRSAIKGNLKLLERLHSEQNISLAEVMNMLDNRVRMNDSKHFKRFKTDFFIEKLLEIYPTLSRDLYLDFVQQEEKPPFPKSVYQEAFRNFETRGFEDRSLFFNIVCSNLPQKRPTHHRRLLEKILNSTTDVPHQQQVLEEWLVLDDRVRLEEQLKDLNTPVAKSRGPRKL